MSEQPNAAEKGSDDALNAAADRLRDSAKWLIASFGAVAAAVFAGLTIADVGDLNFDTPGYRFAIALAGGGAAILGIVAALAKAMQLAGASTTGLADLVRRTRVWELSLRRAREELTADPALKAWGGEFHRFLEDYRDAHETYLSWVRAYAEDPNPRPDSSSLIRAHYRLSVLQSMTGRLLRTVSFIRLQNSFTFARFTIALWLAFAAAGASAFGWATSGPAEGGLELPIRPAAAELAPATDSVNEINRQSPQNCEVSIGSRIRVIVVARGSEEGMVQVVTLPRGSCQPILLAVPIEHLSGPG